MLTMYDGVDPSEVPSGADVYAGYVNGEWPTFGPLVTMYPSALHVSVTINAEGNAQVLDVENGDATALDVPGWVERQRALGQIRPTVYCSRIGAVGEGWQDCIEACTGTGVALPDFWIADYTDAPHGLTLGSVTAAAVQWADKGGYDISLITDPSWPLTSNPPAPKPKPSPLLILV